MFSEAEQRPECGASVEFHLETCGRVKQLVKPTSVRLRILKRSLHVAKLRGYWDETTSAALSGERWTDPFSVTLPV